MVEGEQVGPYRILRRLGEGGMGEVWVAEHAVLRRRAAIKVLRPELNTSEEIVARFFTEARAATAISDPGIVQVYDYGHHAGGAYLAMELLEGETLAARYSRHGPLRVADALRVMRQVASSVGAAHAAGIVHRDLKPDNIFLVVDSEVVGGERAKVLDFGIAKLANNSTVKTATASMMGTPTFMSPEQCRNASKVDARSDVYSLGCVLFTILTDRPPFAYDNFADLIVAHMREQPPVPSTISARIGPELDALILRCLAKDPAARFASGRELALALHELARAGTAERAVGATTAPVPRVVAPGAPTLAETTHPPPALVPVPVPVPAAATRTWLAILAVAALLALLAIAAVAISLAAR